MKKILLLVLALTFVCVGVSFAEIQIDRGQTKDTSKSVFFVGRYARTVAIATSGNEISADRVVIWDSTSNDGVTVNYSTTSFDALVAGVSIDRIPGSSRDYTAASDLNYDNWGRIRAYGRHASVSFDGATPIGASGVTGAPAGSRVAQSAVRGRATVYRGASEDITTSIVGASRDSFGVLLETVVATDGVADIFVKTM